MSVNGADASRRGSDFDVPTRPLRPSPAVRGGPFEEALRRAAERVGEGESKRSVPPEATSREPGEQEREGSTPSTTAASVPGGVAASRRRSEGGAESLAEEAAGGESLLGAASGARESEDVMSSGESSKAAGRETAESAEESSLRDASDEDRSTERQVSLAGAVSAVVAVEEGVPSPAASSVAVGAGSRSVLRSLAAPVRAVGLETAEGSKGRGKVEPLSEGQGLSSPASKGLDADGEGGGSPEGAVRGAVRHATGSPGGEGPLVAAETAVRFHAAASGTPSAEASARPAGGSAPSPLLDVARIAGELLAGRFDASGTRRGREDALALSELRHPGLGAIGLRLRGTEQGVEVTAVVRSVAAMLALKEGEQELRRRLERRGQVLSALRVEIDASDRGDARPPRGGVRRDEEATK